MLNCPDQGHQRVEHRLIYTLEWWHRLALILIKCGRDHTTIGDVDGWLGGVFHPSQRVLHPVFVVALERS